MNEAEARHGLRDPALKVAKVTVELTQEEVRTLRAKKAL